MCKKQISINKVDINRILLFNKVSYGKLGAYKHYIGYNHDEGSRPLYIVIPQINLYTNYMNILVNDKEFLKYIEIWDKIKNLFKKLFKKRFDSEPIYNNKYIKTKINPLNINFYGNKRPKKDEYYDCSVLLIESICNGNDNYLPQTFLETFFKECNNVCNTLIKQVAQINNESDDESDDH